MLNSNGYQPINKRRVRSRTIRGVDYAINEWGEPGKPLFVYLHGFADCAASFQFVVDELADDWHVVAPDWRGFGGSKTTQTAFWFPDYLADLDALLAIVSPERPVRLVGHSMGGNVGALFAGTFPERVAAFVNIEGFGLSDSDPAEAPQRYREWIEAGRSDSRFSSYSSYAALEQRIIKRNPRCSEAIASFVARAWGEERDGVIELRVNPRHKLPNPVLYRRAESEACWRNIRAPVLLISGADSPFGGPDLSIEDAAIEVIPDAGHMMHLDAPAALAGHLERFLAKHL